ncbi:MAG: hypothetical protein GC131_09225 [Alphaproteobacteria bacterium]|nr:hypothetical protein [Alphaproteobacteria bacterium]
MTYPDLIKKFGAMMAYDIMLSVEKMAGLQLDRARQDRTEEWRFQSALERLDEIDAAKMAMEGKKAG